MHWPELTAAIDGFRLVRERTLDMASTLSEEQAARRVRPGTWSAAEVLDHLVRTEVAYRKYQLQVLDRASAGVTGTVRIDFREVDTRLRPLPKSWMPLLAPLLYALHAVTPFRIRLAVMRKPGLLWAAAPKVAEPRSARLLDDLRADLRAEMQQTLALFGGDLPEALRGIRAAHPLYGSNNVVHIIQMMSAHEERHQHQLRAILNTR